MSQLELYAVLRDLGVDEDKAKAAVENNAVVTKADLRAELGELKADLTWRILLAMGFLTTLYGVIVVAAFKFLKP